MLQQGKKVFLVWRIYQRRSASLARVFDAQIRYYHYKWEEKSKAHKLASYIMKTLATLRDLAVIKPTTVIIQLPPNPLLYLVYSYCKIFNSKLIADSHNSMIFSHWFRWPLTKKLLNHSNAVLVHNEDVKKFAQSTGLNCFVVRDPLPDMSKLSTSDVLSRLRLNDAPYIIIPWSFAPDEPIAELFEAAKNNLNFKFVMTWFPEKLPEKIRSEIPSNFVFTGFLPEEEFNTVFKNAAAALVLTTREGTQPSAASEALIVNTPLIISDLKTTRELYREAPVYVKNTPASINEGIQTAISNSEEIKTRMSTFLDSYRNELSLEFAKVKSMLE